MQHHFHNGGASSGESSFKGSNSVITAINFVRRCESMHARYKNILIVRPVKHANHSGARHTRMHPPQDIVTPLLHGRPFKRGVLHALRIYRTDHMRDNAALSRRVHGLQHEKNAPLIAEAATREEAILQGAEVFGPGPQRRFRNIPIMGATGMVIGRNICEPKVRADEQLRARIILKNGVAGHPANLLCTAVTAMQATGQRARGTSITTGAACAEDSAVTRSPRVATRA